MDLPAFREARLAHVCGHSRVARELAMLIEWRGKPGMIVSDNHRPTGDLQDKFADRGTELTSNTILTFATKREVEWHYTAPGKPPLGRLLRNRLPGNG